MSINIAVFAIARHLASFFFTDTATTEIYTLSLHDALPISSLMTPISSVTRLIPRGATIPNSPRQPRIRLASMRSEEHTSELQSQSNLVCRLLLEKKKNTWSHRLRSGFLNSMSIDGQRSRDG